MQENFVVGGTGTSVTVYPSFTFFLFVLFATIVGLVFLIVKRREVPRPLFITLLVIMFLQVAVGVLSSFAIVDVVTQVSSGEADDSDSP